ncbi:hypothetical protein [Variovorax sp. CF079]|uniref:hypothetical protein n=1 Tax=Variovorax sp. CF079 TaxID=1882774 RepID=UPI001480C9C2|nr:hypothetical protein [Variovorax sp. CF079]
MFKAHEELLQLAPGQSLRLVAQLNTLDDGLDGVLSTYDVEDSAGRVVARYEVHDLVCAFHPPSRMSQRVRKLHSAAVPDSEV